MYDEKKPEQEKVYKSDEQLRKEFEEWKRSIFTEYDQDRHDQFLRNRYYKKRDDFST
jgi:hypothetical protein